ncbi:NAD(P)-dependent dehydrogenase (Short-subunit alcohol dehydrogenase family) [Pseudomonas sp. IT-P253]|uniref:SDR family NAD(P)-dependent oxidoreductase n=1 Tax=Pseudomonas sp. IT-P253 TaxID=3026455 RepID=UPI0039DF393C
MNHIDWPDLTFDYRGRHVLVTGGTSGIGAVIAAAYHRAGAQVCVTGTRTAAADYPEDLSGYCYMPLNVLDNDQIENVACALPQLDILVHCAGVALSGDGGSEFDPDTFERALQINLSSFYRMALALQPKLAVSSLPGGASVISIASMTSFFGNPVVPGYGAAKAGLVQLSKTLAIAWAGQGIRVNAVAAGLTETRMTAKHIANDQALEPVMQRTPLKRVAQPVDIAGAVLFLTSSAAAFITGQTLPVDGGYSVVG